MDTRYYMVIIKGEIKTSEIMSCGYNRNTQKLQLVRWHCPVQGMLLLWVIPSNFPMLLQMI